METIYMQVKQKENVSSTRVTLKDIVTLSGESAPVKARLNALHIYTFPDPPEQKQRQLFHVPDLVQKIVDEMPGVTVVPIGEPDVLAEYLPPKKHPSWLTAAKIALVCVLCFFGAAFTIMTFNNDVSATEVMDQIYTAFTGTEAKGFTWIEGGYALGLPIGILVFFNHFSGHRLTTDPTPIEVEMALYEQDVNTALMDYEERQHKDSSAKGGK